MSARTDAMRRLFWSGAHKNSTGIWFKVEPDAYYEYTKGQLYCGSGTRQSVWVPTRENAIELMIRAALGGICEPCSTCGGQGYTLHDTSDHEGKHVQTEAKCPDCHDKRV